MALTLPKNELQGMIVGALSANTSWLAEIAKYNSVPDGLPVGTSTGNYMTDFTAYTVAKGETAIRADGGASTATTYTRVQKYLPVEFYDWEIPQLNDAVLKQISRKAADAVYKAAGTTIIDALSDLPLTTWVELSDSGATFNNFATPNGTAADITANMSKLGSAVSSVLKYGTADWILAHPTAFGNIWGYTSQTYRGVQAVGSDLFFNGLKIFSAQAMGTAAKWGAAAKPCVFVGNNDGLGFGIKSMDVSDELQRRDNGLLTLQLSFSYAYGIHEEAKLLSAVYNNDYTP